MPHDPSVTLRFRPHHFLCVLTYIGRGYSPAFTQNFDALIEHINSGNCLIELVDGPDDICAPRLCDATDTTCHCHDTQVQTADKLALADLLKITKFKGLATERRLRLTKDLIRTLRIAYKNETIRTACSGCEWRDLCTGIAADDFKEAKLK
jgi:hypothetical protein